MKVSELINALEKLQASDAEVRMVTTDYRSIASDLLSVERVTSRNGVTAVILSDE